MTGPLFEKCFCVCVVAGISVISHRWVNDTVLGNSRIMFGFFLVCDFCVQVLIMRPKFFGVLYILC